MTTNTSLAQSTRAAASDRAAAGTADTDAIQANVEALLPAVRARRQEIEQSRRLPRALADALRATGIFTLGVPRAIGGREGAPLELMRIIEIVSAADGSTGWCAMIGLGNALTSGYMPEAGAKEMFADPTAPAAGLAAPAGSAVRVDGGVRVNGRWAFASGITHSEWVWAGCLVIDGGTPRMTPHGPETVHICMPVSEVEIHDTWHVSGLCGTGSNDFSAADVFVPDRRTFALLDPAGHRAEPLYQMPPLPLFVSLVANVGLGLARAAIDDLVEQAQVKTPTLYSGVLADKAVTHLEVARAEAALAAARAFLHSAVEDMWRMTLAGQPATPRQVALVRMASTHAAETGAAVARGMSRLAGGTAIYSTATLQRHARDADAVAHHFTVAPHTWEEAGRVLLGREPIAPVF
jgi:alkylation response protein AidB-like acyl-CoA dehydrogenase